jgi:hypothetical protein
MTSRAASTAATPVATVVRLPPVVSAKPMESVSVMVDLIFSNGKPKTQGNRKGYVKGGERAELTEQAKLRESPEIWKRAAGRRRRK